ncbi:bifunctional 4-hydroxy-2-oxoglutarate aldolase/2-dehydro-3-deoxy-phosphogluconate aldolase [Amycolatopsis thermalba]|uniref:Bifunctional 4-hydroxy-2-oxoglutarate aldolase/2-dehydro-3-deoxy-phosphogluconate aldolase n=1 Tax=Amycolatopsis thermalba TaxID=944492 RepID=A0ABY4NSS0_9PSEU|nr:MULTISPECIES: bifunctional 4-hydroxy-2-oxoglutarate aldolase/2-dehydro-3-deoxy-phosphogluconate aldolase [Amycolatopsis]OXM61460.1 2-dehydro-3-deoxyphosphogluconate aldolase [Amycolatopsis sp. KNN50.9b]UQS23058.1 bifunctional 4-hydroxy-2-oxoglutarate aldolase/2-dehydro-3-deoxy-phosphogluconate aldolase [Amycolatopsis thermalba]
MRTVLRKHNNRFRERLATSRVMGILRADSSAWFADAGQVLYEAGLGVLEVDLATPGALDAIGVLQVELGQDALIGAGGVRTVSAVDRCAAAGVDFIASATFSPDVLWRAQEYALPIVCGALTPTEVDAAWRYGPAAVKLYPAATSGGVRYLEEVQSTLPEVPLVPAGGVSLSDVDGYLAAGALAVGVGSALLGDALDGGRLDELAKRASQVATTADRYA